MLRFPRLKVQFNFQQTLISVLFSLTVHESSIERPPVQLMFASGAAEHIRSETSKAVVFVMSDFVVGQVRPLMTTAGTTCAMLPTGKITRNLESANDKNRSPHMKTKLRI